MGEIGNSPYSDLGRPPLHERELTRMLVRPGALWRDFRIVRETGSTNADLAERARGGAPEGSVLVAEAQSAGRGRLGRRWAAPPRSGLLFSMLLRPAVPAARLGWLPLLTGVAVASAVRQITARARAGRFGDAGGGAVDVRLKWPNDLLVGERKLAGILAERAGDALVVGVGLNVSQRAAELPVPEATSLVLEEAAFADREPLLRAILREFEKRYAEWSALDGDPDRGAGLPALRTEYRGLCATLGRRVSVALPGDESVTGMARDVNVNGCLVVRAAGADRAFSAGDVVHVR